ncbi:MAG TPA: hypothetical protein VGS22_16585, partial [Thermoanaerobaculia bacterium]|nr:hypothetical protein [Thermoanaerobaculia bacterium]
LSRVTGPPLSGHQRAVGELREAFERHGVPAPEPSFLALLLRNVMGDSRAAGELLDGLAKVDRQALRDKGRVRGWFKVGAPATRPGVENATLEALRGL